MRLLPLAWPIFVEHLLHMSVGAIGTFMVSHISDDAVAALGTANQVVAMCLLLFGIISLGASVVVTHHLGAHDTAGAHRIARSAIAVNGWIGLAFSVVVMVLAAPLLQALQLSPRLMAYAEPFLTIMGATLVLEAMNLAISSVLRAHGLTREPMLVAIGQNIFTLLGNCILLYGWFGMPRMGVMGVAISTVAGRLLACVVMWALLHYRVRLQMHWRDWVSLRWSTLTRIMHIGLPAALEQVGWYSAFMVVTAFTARMGAEQLATQTYAMQLVWVVVLCSVAIGAATEIIVGHMVGAGAFDQAYKQLLRSLRLGIAIALVVAVGVAVFAKPLVRLFTHDEAIIAACATLMYMGIVLEPGRVFNLVVINSLRATGDARYPVLMGISSFVLVFALGGWFFGTYLGWGLPGVWLAMICDEWFRGLMMYRRWKRRRWLKYARRTYRAVKAVA
ncbi:MATE family efflux transporter [Curvibacter sp. CHRR-16]|uniref:MATE family efflux transporter n=1 Tax=Curvibacter sp. CHRR-16 TaxID=2835872 RepID=UPI001BD960EB|nr:MATE family efflux transporter [Curvibacter sp. CHRR-16]MBT0569058.1 MATE family efflux transporter [Curvibacter sp. CHRR-16]